VEEYLENLRVDTVDYGETKLAEGLENLLGKYMDALATADTSIKKCDFIVILGGRDGESFGLASNRGLIITPIERELEDVERVLVSIAKRLDQGMYPPDQVSISRHRAAADSPSTQYRHVAGYPILSDK
jgi:hypothetical protein